MDEQEDIFNDPEYVRKSYEIVKEALEQGHEVIHMPNGDINVSEIKRVTIYYAYDKENQKMVRITSDASRTKKKKIEQQLDTK